MGSYPGFRQNVDRVMKDAGLIVERLREIGTTLGQIKAEYRYSYITLYAAIFSQISKEEYRQIAYSKLARGGVKTRFKKGHATWNKNRKGTHFSPATEFKKGHGPQTSRPIGELYIINSKDGKPYRWIKVGDEGVRQRRRMPYAQYVWEQAHGPIPKDWFPRHKDGDSLNDEPSNLMLVDRATNLRLNESKPGVRGRKRHNWLKSMQKVWARKRKETAQKKAAAAKLREQRRWQAAEDRRHRKLREANIVQFRRQERSWFECPACGHEAGRPILPCPKCGSIARYERITQAMDLARRQADEQEKEKTSGRARAVCL